MKRSFISMLAISLATQTGAPAWTRYTASASGPTDALACSAARDKAAAHARAHLGLNLGKCRCPPAVKGQNRTCRIDYEILTKE